MVSIGSKDPPLRVYWHDIERVASNEISHLDGKDDAIQPRFASLSEERQKAVVFRTSDDQILKIGAVTVEGRKRNSDVAQALKL